jgi:hypothetical protein
MLSAEAEDADGAEGAVGDVGAVGAVGAEGVEVDGAGGVDEGADGADGIDGADGFEGVEALGAAGTEKEGRFTEGPLGGGPVVSPTDPDELGTDASGTATLGMPGPAAVPAAPGAAVAPPRSPAGPLDAASRRSPPPPGVVDPCESNPVPVSALPAAPFQPGAVCPCAAASEARETSCSLAPQSP